MADNNDEDLVSNIKVEGGDESAQQIEDFANRGAAAFEKLGDSSKKSADDVAAASKKAGDAAKDSTKSFDDLNKIKFGPAVASQIKSIGDEARKFGASLKTTTQAIGRFAGRVALIGSAAQAAAIAFTVSAEKIAKSVDTASSALKDQTQAQIEANSAAGNAEQASIQLQSSQRSLLRDLQTGKISYQDYNKAIQDSNDQAREQARVAAQVANAQARVKEENDRLQKSLANREAMNKLIDQFGGPLTQSLIAFGRQVEATRKSFLDGFGPGLSSLVDNIGAVFTKNGAAISKFFDDMGAKLQQFVTQNGPALQLAIENIGQAGAAIFEGLIAAGPPLLDFFNNQLIPAFKSVGSFFNSVADTINQAFGTKLTGGFLILIGLVLQLTGGLRLLFALLNTGIPLVIALGKAFFTYASSLTPAGIAIRLAAAALIYFLTQVDWKAWFAAAQVVFAGVVKFFSDLSTVAQAAADAVKQKLRDMSDFIAAIPGNIAQLFADMWAALVDSTKEFVANTLAEFDALVKFFTDFPSNVKIIWNAAGQFLVDAFNLAVDKVKTFLRDLRDTAMSYLQPIVDLIKSILGTVGSIGAGSSPPGFAKGGSPGHVRGPGTSTSDSILARLSNNEFVVRASAVRKYGVDFLNAVNTGRFKMPKFSLGGLNVIGPSLSRPSFADGGPVGGGGAMRPINLSILGETFNGLLAPEDTAARLHQFAVRKQSRSAGRRPQWQGN